MRNLPRTVHAGAGKALLGRGALATLVLLALALAGCDGGGTTTEPPQTATEVELRLGGATVGLLSFEAVEDSLQLEARATGSNGLPVQRPFTWSSANEAVATVSSTGLVRATGAGTTTVTARADGVSASVAVEVRQHPRSVEVAPSAATLDALEDTVTLVATVRDRNGHPAPGAVVSWRSSSEAIATVSAAGRVAAVANGSVTITAALGDIAGTAAVHVEQSVATVEVAPAESELTALGATVQLTAVARDANGHPVAGRSFVWTSSDAAVATVSSSGEVTAVANGAASIRAATGDVAGSAEVAGSATVRVNQLVASVRVTPASAALLVGQTVQFSAQAFDAHSQPIEGIIFTWTSSNAALASVDIAGLARGVAAGGPVTITASGGGSSGTAAVTVGQVPVASVTVAPPTATVQVGSTVQLTATLRDATGNVLTGRTVTWSSADPSLATVSAEGLVTGVAAGGPVTITATSEGVSGTSAITVTLAPVETVEVTPATSTVQVGATRQLTATLRDARGNVLSGRNVSWSSSDQGIATVSAAGLVTGVAVGGPVTITATSEGKSGAAVVTVTQQLPPPPPADLSCGAVRSDTITPVGDLDLFTFDGTAGRVVTIRVAAQHYHHLWNPRIELFSQAGELLQVANSGGFGTPAVITVALPESERYTIAVSDAGSNYAPGFYGLALFCLSDPGGSPLSYGATVADQIAPIGDHDLFTFSGIGGEVVTVRVAAQAYHHLWNPRIELFDQAGELLQAAHSGGFGSPAVITLTLPVSGTFGILVSDAGSDVAGNYGLTLQRLSDPEGAPISYGETIVGQIAPVGDHDLFTFSGASGEMVRVTVAAQAYHHLWNPRIEIYSPAGDLLQAANSGGFGSPAVIMLPLPASGTFGILVSDAGSDITGNYGLTLQRLGG